MYLIAGSYEKFIWGFKLKTLTLNPTPHPLTLLFSYPSHLSTIKSVAISGSVAVSGSNDDTIKIYDLSTSSEIGSLHHTSSITSLSFFSPPSLSSFPRNLISSDSEGFLSTYDADPFVFLKSVKVHKKSVNCLSVHPSGKVALTVGHDDCLGMVNLVRGRRSFYSRLDREVTIVTYDEIGERFFMVDDEKVGVHDSEDARLVLELGDAKRVLCASPGANGILFTAGEDKNLTAWDTKSGKMAYQIEDAHAARIKGLVVMSKNTSDEDPYIVASASSDGVIRVWDVRTMVNKGMSNPLAEVNTKSRLTCLAASSIKGGDSGSKPPRLGYPSPDGRTDVAEAES